MEKPQPQPQGTDSRLSKYIDQDVRILMRNSGKWWFARVVSCCPVDPDCCVIVRDYDLYGRATKKKRLVRLATKPAEPVTVRIEVLKLPEPAKQ